MESIKQVGYKQIVEKAAQASRSQAMGPEGFAQTLETKLNHEVKFSKHALDRINSRGIQLSNSELQGLRQAVGKASDKGLKESLVMLKDTALIVSIRNKTVITALKKESLKDRIITNVDGVVIL